MDEKDKIKKVNEILAGKKGKCITLSISPGIVHKVKLPKRKGIMFPYAILSPLHWRMSIDPLMSKKTAILEGECKNLDEQKTHLSRRKAFMEDEMLYYSN